MINREISYHFEGEIPVTKERPYGQDYLQFLFDVPDRVGEVKIRLIYEPGEVNGIENLITLGVFDPSGFRGNAHRHQPDLEVSILPERASHGFIPGPIQSGNWTALLALHAVSEGVPPCRYTLDIRLNPISANEKITPMQPLMQNMGEQGNRWYSGELHSHTLHSDGSLEGSELIQQAQLRGLDFLAITDHNTNSVLGELSMYLKTDQKPLIIPGIELTTFFGHALVLGIKEWVDWRTGINGWTMDDAARAIHEQGGILIVAHPNDAGTPICTGCRWEYEQFDLNLADGIEIWNGKWEGESPKNPGSLQMWRSNQMNSKRITATAGSDFHNRNDWGDGSPRVYVNARHLSVEDILDGIREGRVVVSSGPMVLMEITSENGSEKAAGIGETLIVKNEQAEVLVHWTDAPDGSRLILRSQKDIIGAWPVNRAGSLEHEVHCSDDDRFWIELFSADGTLLAMTNPVFVQVIQ